jgi:hypothetical protein
MNQYGINNEQMQEMQDNASSIYKEQYDNAFPEFNDDSKYAQNAALYRTGDEILKVIRNKFPDMAEPTRQTLAMDLANKTNRDFKFGGRRRKSRKGRKSRKSRKSRKTRKTRRR